jgi:hypothetical protein
MTMIASKPVVVQRGAFLFCRTSLAVALWVALVLRLPWLVAATAVVLALSALLTVARAPLVVAYTWTLGRVWPGGSEVLDERAMRFAHLVGALMVSASWLLLIVRPRSGYVCLALVAVAKTAGALGFCSALRFYGCMNSDTCCRWADRRA